MGRLTGKVAIVTGSASGIGEAILRFFAREGASVVGGDINGDAGQAVVDDVVNGGGDACFVPLDASSEADWARIVAAAGERYGGLTSLVNNAGIFLPGGVEDTSASDWDRIMQVSQKSVWLGMKAAMPLLKKSGNASIVNMSSILGLVGDPGSFAYSAAKGAIRSMSKSAALEGASSGVRVNSLHPGMIKTALLGDVPDHILAAHEQVIPIGRRADPMEVAYVALFLCSDEARYMTGSEIVVDGGLTAR